MILEIFMMGIRRLFSFYNVLILALYLNIKIVRSSILNEIKSSNLFKSNNIEPNNDKYLTSIPNSIYKSTDNSRDNHDKNEQIRLNMENEVADAQYYSKMSKIYSKTPYIVNKTMFPDYSANYLKPDKFSENFYKSSSMLIMEDRIDNECVGELLEAEKISEIKMVSFKCPSGSAISYINFEYKEMIYKPKKNNRKSNLRHTEIAITGLGFGCDDNQSVVYTGSLSRRSSRLSIPRQKKMWIYKAIGFIDRSITGQEYLTGLSVSGIDGTFGVNTLNNEMHIGYSNKENPPVVPKGYLTKSKEWSGSFITGGCIGLHKSKTGIFINKIALIPIRIHPINSVPLNIFIDNYSYIDKGIRTKKVLAVPKLWPECQMLFGKSSGIPTSNFFLFKITNKSTSVFFNFVEVKYNSKKVPISVEFKETKTGSSVLIGKQSNESSITSVSRVGSISQITIGISEGNMSEIYLGLISYLEVVIDGINTIFIQESVPSYRRTFSGNGLKYICVEISNSGALLGFGAFLSKKLYVLPFINAGVQTHYSDLNATFYSSSYSNSDKKFKDIKYVLPQNKKRSFKSIVDFTSDRTIDVYQGKSIINNICDFGESSINQDDIEFYLVTCKPGYYLKSFHIFTYFAEDIIRAFEMGCGNGEVRIGEKTPYKRGIKIVENVQEPQSLSFEIGFKGSNLSQSFLPVSLKLYNSQGVEVFQHRTVDLELKKVITSDSKVSWKYSTNGPFKGLCFAIDTNENKLQFRGISLAKSEKNHVSRISSSTIRPNIFYPLDYRALGPAYIAFGNVAIATRIGFSEPEECNNHWIVDRSRKKMEKIKNIGSFAFTCPKGHIITHIHAAPNRNTGLMGIIGLLCSDGYSGAVIGSSENLLEFENISLVENLLSINPPYFIKSVIAGTPKVLNDKFLAKLETYAPSNSIEKNLIYKYLSKKAGLSEKREIKIGEDNNGPYDTFCALVKSKFIGNYSKSKKEGILNIGLKPAPKFQSLKGGNPIKVLGNIFVNQVSYPQCQMIRSSLSTEIRETFTVSCPNSSKFTKIIPIKYNSGENSEIRSFLIKCDSGGIALLGYTSFDLNLETINIPQTYKAHQSELPMQYLTEIDVSFDFKKPGIQGFDLFVNDGRSNIYPIGINKEEISTLYTRRYIGDSLSMICFEFGEDSKEITGFGAYFESQGLYWESDFILPPTNLALDNRSKLYSKIPSMIEKSGFISLVNTHVLNSETVCKDWVGIHDLKKHLSFALSCGMSSIKYLEICFPEEGAEITGIEVICDTVEQSSFSVGVCNEKYKRNINKKSEKIGEIEFGFSKITNKLGFFLLSTAEGMVISKYRSNIIKSEGLGSSIYWSSDSTKNQILSTLCFDVVKTNGKIQAIGIPYETNVEIWKKIQPIITEDEIGTYGERHYASEPKESRTVRGVPRINSEMNLEDTHTVSLNKLYGGYITYDKDQFSSYCRKLIGIHKEDSKPIAILCPASHRIANIMLYLNSPAPDGYIVGMKVACHGQFKSQRSSLEDSWTGMFNIGTVTKYIYKEGTQATIFKRLSFGLNSENKIVHVYVSDSIGRRYLKYANSEETISKITEYTQSENYNYLRGLCFEVDEHDIHRIGFVIE